MLSNCADDNNLFIIRKDINKVQDTLAKDFGIVTNLFYKKFMVLNSKKWHFICIGRDVENETFIFKDVCYIKTERKKLFWI